MAGTPVKSLHEHPLGGKGDFGGVGTAQSVRRDGCPSRHGLDVGGSYRYTSRAQEVLEDHLDGVGACHFMAVGQRVDDRSRRRRRRRSACPGAEGVGRGGGEVVWAMDPFCSAGASERRAGPCGRAVAFRYGAVPPAGQRYEQDEEPDRPATDWMTQVAVGPPIIRARTRRWSR